MKAFYIPLAIAMGTGLLPLTAMVQSTTPGTVQTEPGKTAKEQIAAAAALIERITPGYVSQFELEIIPSENGKDVYEIDKKGNKVVLRGNNPVSLASAFNWYLKYTCNAHVSWFGDQLNLPKQLPLPSEKERRVIDAQFRPYMNYCTLNYTASWWDWERWQREIDFMAMNGVNMPLFMTGLEGVWYNTLKRFNFSDEEARKFLVGPCWFAWQWMQNIEGVGGPLPKSWIDSHVKLGQQILKRELELGMTPIQQGFSGYVPGALKEKYPDAKIATQGRWCGFPGASQLDPTDPLFKKIGKVFLEEEKKLFGAHGYYAADPFHESSPPVKGNEYLTAVGNAINDIYKEHDPNYTWVLQAWSLYRPIIESCPQGKLLILDLNGTKRGKHNFWGHPFIAGNLHNFGGRINMHGDMPLVSSNQYASIKKSSPNVVGAGLFMEGIEQNPAYYEMAFEMPNHEGAIDAKEWLSKYATRRYGAESKASQEAWHKLLEGPYRKGTNGTEQSSIIAARPAINVKKSGPNAGFRIPYPPKLLIEAQELLLTDAYKLKGSKPYRFDIVDVQRQIMSNLGQAIHKKAMEAYEKKDKEGFKLHGDRFLQLIKETDTLLRTRSEFNFDKWLTDARKWGDNKQEKDLYERDATALVTIWGPDTVGDPIIFDYGWREWSGLIEGFYFQRWNMFYEFLQDNLDNNKEYTEKGLKSVHGREAFKANDIYKKMADWELKYVDTPNKARTPITQGDEVETALKMFKKYAKMANEYYTDTNGVIQGNENEERFENLGEKPQS